MAGLDTIRKLEQLHMREDLPVWEFPPDYIDRLRAKLDEVHGGK